MCNISAGGANSSVAMSSSIPDTGLSSPAIPDNMLPLFMRQNRPPLSSSMETPPNALRPPHPPPNAPR